MLKTYEFNGSLWQFEEGSEPAGAVERKPGEAPSAPVAVSADDAARAVESANAALAEAEAAKAEAAAAMEEAAKLKAEAEAAMAQAEKLKAELEAAKAAGDTAADPKQKAPANKGAAKQTKAE